MGWSETEQKGKLFKNEKIHIGSKFIVASYLEKNYIFLLGDPESLESEQ